MFEEMQQNWVQASALPEKFVPILANYSIVEGCCDLEPAGKRLEPVLFPKLW